jgi:hypothetical protein
LITADAPLPLWRHIHPFVGIVTVHFHSAHPSHGPATWAHHAQLLLLRLRLALTRTERVLGLRRLSGATAHHSALPCGLRLLSITRAAAHSGRWNKRKHQSESRKRQNGF